jgi:hypothetical protein
MRESGTAASFQTAEADTFRLLNGSNQLIFCQSPILSRKY